MSNALRWNRFILGYNPIAFVRPVNGALVDLARAAALTTPSPLTASTSGDEYESGPIGTQILTGNGTSDYVSYPAIARYLANLNGKPWTFVIRYQTVQSGLGTLFYQGNSGGTEGIMFMHNGLFPGFSDGNRLGVYMFNPDSTYRLFGGYHAGTANDGQPHTHVMAVDPAVLAASGPLRYYCDGTRRINNNTAFTGSWNPAFNPTTAAVDGSMYARKIGASIDGYFGGGIIAMAIIPTLWTQEEVEQEQRIWTGLDRPVRHAKRVMNSWPRDATGSAAVVIEGDSQDALASSGSGDQLRAWGEVNGLRHGFRRIGPAAASRLMLTRDVLGQGWENPGDGVGASACTGFNTAIPAEISDQFAQNTGAGKLAYLACQSAWKGAGAAAASGGALIYHLLEDFAQNASDGMSVRALVVGLKSTSSTVTAELVNNTSGAVVANGTFAVGGPAVVDADYFGETANYWYKMISLALPANATIPTQQNASTPQILLRFSTAGNAGVIAYRCVSASGVGIGCSLFAAAGGSNTRNHVDLLYNSMTIAQIANWMKLEVEFMTRLGLPPKIIWRWNLGTNDTNDLTASYNSDGTTNGANPPGSSVIGCYNNTLAAWNRIDAARQSLGWKADAVTFIFNGTQSWGSLTRLSACTSGVLRMLRDNPQIRGVFANGELISPLGWCMDRAAYMVVAAGTITAITASGTPVVTSAAHGLPAGADVYLDATDSTPPLLGKYAIASVTTDTFTLADGQITTTGVGTKGVWRCPTDTHLDRSGNAEHSPRVINAIQNEIDREFETASAGAMKIGL